MDIERLKELRRQIVGEHWGINGDDLKLLYNLLPLVNEAIARQSVKSEEVRDAIEWFRFSKVKFERGFEAVKNSKSDYRHDAWVNTIKTFNLAVTALQAYQPKPTSEDVAISKTETTSEEVEE